MTFFFFFFFFFFFAFQFLGGGPGPLGPPPGHAPATSGSKSLISANMHFASAIIANHFLPGTRHCIIIFGNFFRGGGAKFKFVPGRQIPSLRHCKHRSILQNMHIFKEKLYKFSKFSLKCD